MKYKYVKTIFTCHSDQASLCDQPRANPFLKVVADCKTKPKCLYRVDEVSKIKKFFLNYLCQRTSQMIIFKTCNSGNIIRKKNLFNFIRFMVFLQTFQIKNIWNSLWDPPKLFSHLSITKCENQEVINPILTLPLLVGIFFFHLVLVYNWCMAAHYRIVKLSVEVNLCIKKVIFLFLKYKTE